MLVSDWYLETKAAVQLTTRTVQIMEQEKRMLPAEALRRAMLEFVDSPKSVDDPYPGIWAPFHGRGTESARKPLLKAVVGAPVAALCLQARAAQCGMPLAVVISRIFQRPDSNLILDQFKASSPVELSFDQAVQCKDSRAALSPWPE